MGGEKRKDEEELFSALAWGQTWLAGPPQEEPSAYPDQDHTLE